MAILINGNGNPAIYAAQDADLIASLAGNTTGIAKVGNECAYSAQDANTISVADGVIVTKEGRRIQLDAGENDTFIIPAGTVGVTNYYIIGYQLHENASGQQVADTFVQLMANATETIQEDTFRGGASDVYVSLYRVEQDGVNLGTITLLLPKLTNISQIDSDITQINSALSSKQEQYVNVQFTIPASSSGLVHVNYPDGYDMYKIVTCLRVYDSVNGELTVNPAWALVTMYLSDMGILLNDVPSSYQGQNGWITLMKK